MEYNPKLLRFFKKHNLYDETMFDYFMKNTTMIDYQKEEQRIFIGCYYTFDCQGILRNIHLTLPYIYDEVTMLISIHELIHAVELYQKLNEKTEITDSCEVLPMLYEEIYINETPTTKTKEHQEQTEKIIRGSNLKKYIIALSVREELYQKYNYNFEETQKLAKKLVNKHKKNQ